MSAQEAETRDVRYPPVWQAETLEQLTAYTDGDDYVYFLLANDDAWCKIGRSYNPKLRAAVICRQAGVESVRMEKVIRGGIYLERALHRALSGVAIPPEKVGGMTEWFYFTPELRTWLAWQIEAVCGTCGDFFPRIVFRADNKRKWTNGKRIIPCSHCGSTNITKSDYE